MDTSNMKVSTALKKAKKLINTPNKWVKGALTKGNKHCAIGAVLTAVPNPIPGIYDPQTEQFRRHMRQLLNAALPSERNHNSVMMFNDEYDTKHRDVMDLFDMAITFAELNEEESEK